MSAPTPAGDAQSLVGGQHVLKAVLRRFWVVLAVALIGALAGIAVSALKPTSFTSTATVIAGYSAADALVTANGVPSVDPKVQQATQVGVLTSEAVKVGVESSLGYKPSISISAPSNSQLINITASSSSPQKSANDANMYVRTYLNYLRAQSISSLKPLQASIVARVADEVRRLAEIPDADTSIAAANLRDQLSRDNELLTSVSAAIALPSIGAQSVSVAQPPSEGSGASTSSLIALSALIGAFLGVGAALILDSRDDRLHGQNEIEAVTGLPLLGDFGGSDLQSASMVVASLLISLARREDRYVVIFAAACDGVDSFTVAQTVSNALKSSNFDVVLMDAQTDEGRDALRQIEMPAESISATSVPARLPAVGDAFSSRALVSPRSRGRRAVVGSAHARFAMHDVNQPVSQSSSLILISSGPPGSASALAAVAAYADAAVLVLGQGPQEGKDVRRSLDGAVRLGLQVVGAVRAPRSVLASPSTGRRRHDEGRKRIRSAST